MSLRRFPFSLLPIVLAAILDLCVGLAGQSYDFTAAARYSERHNGHALLVAIGGKIVFERYANGWSAAKPHRLASGTKSFSGVLLAMAADDGLLGIDEKLAVVLPEWRSDPRKSRITYRQLLGLHSGIEGGVPGQKISYSQAIHARTIADPGKVFSYGPVPFQIFGEALKRKLAPRKETVAAYVQRRLLGPLGMNVPYWTDWRKGEPRLPGGAWMPAREWWKFGELVRRGGTVGGKRLVSASRLAELFRPGPVRPTYGISWWLPAASSAEPDDAVMAKGAGKQRLYVIPSHDMVLVRLGESAAFDDEVFLSLLMPAAVAPYGAGCRGRAGVPDLGARPSSRPVVGGRFAVLLANLPAAATGALWLGASRSKFGSIPLPWDLSPYGMPGCSLWTSVEAALAFQGSAGTVAFSLPVPADKTLSSKSFYMQAVVLDRGANTLGATLSNALAARVGVR